MGLIGKHYAEMLALAAVGAAATSCSLKDFSMISGATPAAKKDTKPLNVLLIAVDDLRVDLGCYGDKNVKSPNIDALAARGALFESAYCQQAVCAPSRISLLTGLRPDTTGIVDLKHPLRKTRPNTLSMPQYFKENGYTTISLGKIYHHYNDDNGIGWSEPAWHPEDLENKKWKGEGYLDPKSWAMMGKPTRPGQKVRPGKGPAFEAPDVPDEAYPDGRTAIKAIATLERLKKAGKPFFLGVGFKKPHLPFNAPKKYWDMYPESSITIPAQKDWPKGMPPMAPNGKNGNWELSNYPGIPDERPLPAHLAKTLIRGYRACTTFTDVQIGKVIAALDKLGLADNTVIVLFGDHGWKLDEYSAWCKHTNFELDAHAPLIVIDPRLKNKAGERIKSLVEFVDIFPTLCDLCDLPIPKSCEGTSFTPLLNNPNLPWKEAAFSQFPRWPHFMGYTIRSGKWRYTEWIDKPTGQIKARELYDHSKSPIATVNLANNPEYAPIVDKLSKLIDKGQGWREIRGKLETPKK